MIGVIGCGNMASAIAVGIYNSTLNSSLEAEFKTYTPSYTRAAELAEKVKGEAVKTLDGLNDCDYLLIGCKPQQFDDLATNLKELLPNLKDKYIISMMAAVSVESIQKKLGVTEVTRVMPNTPIRQSEGISLLFHKTQDDSKKSYVADLFKACSQTFNMESEEQFDKVTTVSGSGPAYVFYFTELFANNLCEMGMNEEDATKLAIQLMKGSVALMHDRGEATLSQLVDQVTSKKGVTIEAVEVFRHQGLPALVKNALGAAYKRSEEMTKDNS